MDSQVVQGILEINGLVHTDAGINELCSIGSYLYSHLVLGIPVLQDVGGRPPSDEVMQILHEGDKLSTWSYLYHHQERQNVEA